MQYDYHGCDVDDNGYRQLEFRTVVARKDHTCCYCKKTTAKGEKYIRHVFVDDDGFCSQASHLGQGLCDMPEYHDEYEG